MKEKKKRRTCEKCSACTKITRYNGEKFFCWGVSEPFEIEDLTQNCPVYPWAEEDPNGHWKDRTDRAIEEEREEKRNKYEKTIDTKALNERINLLEKENKKLRAMAGEENFDYKEAAEDWKSIVDTMKNRPEYKKFQDELEAEGFFTGTGLGTPDFGEVYKRYFAQKKTIQQHQKYIEQLEQKLELFLTGNKGE